MLQVRHLVLYFVLQVRHSELPVRHSVLQVRHSVLVSPGILVLESLAAGSHDRLPTPLERDLAEA